MKKIKDIFTKIKRKLILLDMVDYIGNLYIKNYNVMCRVDDRKFRNRFDFGNCYDICLCGCDSRNLGLDDKNYFEDKPICYVFDGIVFDKGVNIETFFDVNVIFKNCTFNDYINLNGVGNVTFKNNKYYNKSGINDSNNSYFRGHGNYLKFIDENFINSDNNVNFGMDINFNVVEFVDSNIEIDKKSNSKFLVRAKELLLDNVTIDCPYICFNCEDIICLDDSVIGANKRIDVNNKTSNFNIMSVIAPFVIHNGSLVRTIDSNKSKNNLISSRQKLIEELKVISRYFSNINNSEIKKAHDDINNRAIKRILSK